MELLMFLNSLPQQSVAVAVTVATTAAAHGFAIDVCASDSNGNRYKQTKLFNYHSQA